MTEFLIANMIKAGAPLRTPHGWAENEYDLESWRTRIFQNDFAYFDVSVPAKIYWQGRQDYFSLEEDFGPIRPPYPLMWMEWKVPQRIQIGGRWDDRPREMVWAAAIDTVEKNTQDVDTKDAQAMFDMLARSYEVRKTPDTADLQSLVDRIRQHSFEVINVQVNLLLAAPDGRSGVVIMPVRKSIVVNPETGHYMPGTCVDLAPNDAAKSDPHEFETIREMCDYNVVWMALQLINCRNVTTRQVGSVFTRSGSDKRRGEPVTRYHTIILPGTSRPPHSGHRKVKTDPLALHKVRGHFKTFTADKPLLGQHVGTYWWGWQVRGNAEKGVVVSDYKLASTTQEKVSQI